MPNVPKWFATPKTLERFDKAAQLVWTSPCDPKTLTRAARDHHAKEPAFTMQAALAALHWMSMGHGHERTDLDTHEAQRLAHDGAKACHQKDLAPATAGQAIGRMVNRRTTAQGRGLSVVTAPLEGNLEPEKQGRRTPRTAGIRRPNPHA